VIDFFKNLIAERIIIKIIGFIFAMGILPILIFLYGLGEEPEWINKKEHYLKHHYSLTVKSPLELFNLQKSKDILKSKAKQEFKQEVYNRAIKQIKVSYDWDTLDNTTRELLKYTLTITLDKNSFDDIIERSIYENNLKFKIFGLYSMENIKIDIILQNIYQKINNKMMEKL